MRVNNFFSLLYPLALPENIKTWDKLASDEGLEEFLLMENAGRAAVNVLHNLIENLYGKKALILMGNGNNGGDAASVARNLNDFNVECQIFSFKTLDELSPICKKHLKLALYSGSKFYTLTQDIVKETSATFLQNIFTIFNGFPDIIIDGLLGTGFQGQLKEKMLNFIEAINFLTLKIPSIKVLSLDIPSGLNATTGKVSPTAIKANATANFAALKMGEIFSSSKQWTGKLYNCNIGIPQKIITENAPKFWLLDGHILKNLPALATNTYKNFYGHVTIIGGRKGLAGAANLAALGSLCCGAGLVTVMAPTASCSMIKSGLPEVMTMGLGEINNYLWPENIGDKEIALLEESDAIVIGPGFGREADSEKFLKNFFELSLKKPLIVDADALILLSQNRNLIKYIKSSILTPHPGEAAQLLNCSNTEIQKDRVIALERLCAMFPESSIILKGANSLIGQKNMPWYICPYDIPQLAIAGAGDVLSGCIGALAANKLFENYSTLQKASIGVILHALAGKIAGKLYPMRGLRASTLAKTLPKVINYYKNFPDMERETVVLPWPE